METKVEEIRIVPVKPDSHGLLGFTSFVVDRKFYFGNIAIFSIRDGSGIRLCYPKKGQLDCMHPVNREVGEEIRCAVEAEFKNHLNNLISNENENEQTKLHNDSA
jgi:DNA-binding cell septation regulator SpoVG